MPNAGKEVYSFRDVTGQVESTSMFVTSAATAATLTPIIQNLSNAHLSQSRGPTTTADDGVAGANATYVDVEDKGVFIFKGVGGSTHRYQVPAPKDAIFLATNHEVIDGGNALVTAFVNQMLLTAVDANGSLLTSFSRGFRARRRSKRG